MLNVRTREFLTSRQKSAVVGNSSGNGAAVALTSRARPVENPETNFEGLFRAHHRAVLGFCVRRSSPSEAWEAASEVFVVAWRRIDDIPEGDLARAWLFGVAVRVLANQRRGASRRTSLVDRLRGIREPVVAWPDDVVVRNETELLVLEVVESLGPIDREILRMSNWEQLDPDEIALALGITRSAVDQRASRARRRFAREFERRAGKKWGATQSMPSSEEAG